MNKGDQYCGYELLMLLDLLNQNAGSFHMNENGTWFASVKDTSYQGMEINSNTLRRAYFFIMKKCYND